MPSHAASLRAIRIPSEDAPVRVLVGWDATNTEAVEFAAWLGRSMPVRVQVTSTYQSPWAKAFASKGSKKRKKWLKDASEAFHNRVVKVLEQHLPRSQWSSVPAKIVDNKPATRSLYDTAADFNADLILLGSRAKAPKGRFRPSTVADELMRSSPVPLGLAPRGVKLSKKGITRVTYAIVEPDGGGDYPDFSGLAFATALSCYLRVPLRIIAFSPTQFERQPAGWNEATLGLLDRARDCAWDMAEQIAPDHLEAFDVQSSVSSAKSWKRAIDSVKWKKGDVMCLGSQPTGQLMSVFVGTREGEFVRYAPVPVIVCPRASEAAE